MMRRLYSTYSFAALLLFPAVSARADITLPHILAEHMVIQRGLPVHIWGKASPGESVAVAFGESSRTVTADALGRWSVYLPPADAGGPFTLTIRGNNTIEFKDVLVGDVWVASGQSNMEFKLSRSSNSAVEIAAAKYPNIRRTIVDNKVSNYPMDDVTCEPWTDINPATAGGGSAVAYYFARHLHEKEGVPIGILESTWSGTPVESWISLRAIGEDPGLMPIFRARALALDTWPAQQPAYEKQIADWNAMREAAAASPGPASTRPNPAILPSPRPGGPYEPSGLYNAKIAPITAFPIKGVIWYQGESNASDRPNGASLYTRAFSQMIRDWRRAWHQGDFPFLFVQLPNFKSSSAWVALREAQRQTLSVVNTGMAVTIDVGIPDNLHPPNKVEVGERLALAARALAYGEKIEYAGPVFVRATSEGSALRSWFSHTTGGLRAGRLGDAPVVKGFEIAGADRKFVPADARLDGSTVLLSSTAIATPVYLRYAWEDSPDCNLYNGEGLPAWPFQSE